MTPEEKAADARARRWAKKMGYEMVRGTKWDGHARNIAGYQLRDGKGKVIAGKNYDLSPQDILAMCEAKDAWQATSVPGQKLRLHCEETGCSMQELTVLSSDNDPYRHDNEGGHVSAKWFAEMVERFVGASGTVHNRGLHYRVSTSGDVMRPTWNAARCLHWVPFRQRFFQLAIYLRRRFGSRAVAGLRAL